MYAGRMHRAFNTWHGVARHNAYYKKVVVRAANIRQLKAFLSWRDRAQFVVHQRTLLRRSLEFFRGNVTAIVFSTWRYNLIELSRTKQRMEVLYRRTLARFQKIAMVHSFEYWRAVTEVMHEKRAAVKCSLMHMLNRRLAVAYGTWRHLWTRCRRRRAALSGALARLIHGALSQAFNGWRDNASGIARQRWLLDRCARRMRLLQVSKRTSGAEREGRFPTLASPPRALSRRLTPLHDVPTPTVGLPRSPRRPPARTAGGTRAWRSCARSAPSSAPWCDDGR